MLNNDKQNKRAHSPTIPYQTTGPVNFTVYSEMGQNNSTSDRPGNQVSRKPNSELENAS